MNNNSFRFLSKMFLLVVALLSISGCARTIYGVPQDEWTKLTEQQKTAAINGYNEREKLREQARAAEAEKQIREHAEKAAEQKRQQEAVQRRIDAIYAGEAGNIGDLIRVSIQGGDMLFGNRHRPFQPLSFKLASGESRMLTAVSNDRNYNDSVELKVSYQDGLLLVDEAEFRPDLATRLAYEAGWKRGASYTISSRGYRELRNVIVSVEIIPHLRRHGGKLLAPVIVGEAPVEYGKRPLGESQHPGLGNFVLLSAGHINELRQIAVDIQSCMQLDSALFLPKRSPGKCCQADNFNTFIKLFVGLTDCKLQEVGKYRYLVMS